MRRKIVAVWVSLAMMFGFVVIVDIGIDFIPTVKGATLYVNETGSGGAYTSIQDAINHANNGDTVYVYNGTYSEKVKVNRTINLIGEDRDATIINSGGSENVVIITSDWVNITGFELRNSAQTGTYAGIYFSRVENCKIYDNNLNNNWNGIYIFESSDNTISGNNIFSNTMDGIRSYSPADNIITDNKLYNNHWHGINMRMPYGNIIANNEIYNNDYDGIYLDMGGSDNNLSNNNITNNKYGITLSSLSDNEIGGNDIWDNDEHGIWLSSSSSVKIIDNNVSSNNGYGIYLASSPNSNLTGNNLTNDGVVIGGSQLSHYNTHIIPDNNIVNGKPLYYFKDSSDLIIDSVNTGQLILANCVNLTARNLRINDTDVGIEIAFSTECVISINNISSNDFTGIYILQSSNNNISYNNATFNTNGISIQSSSYNDFIKNNVTNNINTGIYIYESSKNNVTDNNVSSNSEDGIYFVRSNSNNIRFNKIIDNGNVGIYLPNPSGGGSDISTNNNIYGNNISSNDNHGVYFELYCRSNKVTGNNISSNSGYGVYNYYAQNNNINYNNVTDHGTGIYLQGTSTNCKIIGNSIFSNSNGIYLYYYASKNQITHNEIYDNGYGIRIRSECDTLTIMANNISNNSKGIHLSSFSSGSKIYHNNFVNNTNQAYDDTSTANKWDNGYPSGGNYWDDYTGTDANGDGIGDIPYNIDSNTKDNYPLMEPYPNQKPVENYTLLRPGWNLISTPLIQNDQNLAKVLESIHGYYDAVEWYSPMSTGDHWKHYKAGKPFGNDLFHLNEAMGFWIHINHSRVTPFLYNGTQPTENQTMDLLPGWNLVGYPSKTGYNRTNGLNNLTFDTHVDSIMTYNATTKKWVVLDENTDYFEVCQGYWIHATTECEWEVPL